jgi:hypothetical protein
LDAAIRVAFAMALCGVGLMLLAAPGQFEPYLVSDPDKYESAKARNRRRWPLDASGPASSTG